MNNLFNSRPSNAPVANAVNASGGKAYKLDSQAALAKYVCTGTFNSSWSASAEAQLDRVLGLCRESSNEFIAQLAIYARQHGQMKDTPAFLVAYLANEDIELCKRVFSRVIDTPKMLRNFIQIIRSGVVGRKSLGSAPKKLVQNYLNAMTDEQLFKADVGNNPSLPDIIKMMHPKPGSKEREALYAYLIGKEPKNKEADKDYLLPLARQFEDFKAGRTLELPDVPFQMLTALPLSEKDWSRIAERATFHQVRQNLNTFARHGVFKDPALVKLIAQKLSNVDEVRRSRVFPYQLFTTFMNVGGDVPNEVKYALEPAVETACENVPNIEGDIKIALDTSGSMSDPATGSRGSVTTKTRYIDIAALFAAAILRKNKNAEVIPFDTEVNKKNIHLNPHDSIMTNAQKLAGIHGGGTDCSVALLHLNKLGAKASSVIYISDNESWVAYAGGRSYRSGTGMMEEWDKFAKRNKGSKLINIDITPRDTTQVARVPNTLLVSGFSDLVFTTIAGFVREEGNDDYWLNTIREIKL